MRYTVKYYNNKIGDYLYLHWSDIIKAPVTNFLDRYEFKKWYIEQYSEYEYNLWDKGYRKSIILETVIKKYNIRYKKKLDENSFLNIFLNFEQKDILLIANDKIEPGLYRKNNSDKIYNVLLTVHYLPNASHLVISKLDDKFISYELYDFYKNFTKENVNGIR